MASGDRWSSYRGVCISVVEVTYQIAQQWPLRTGGLCEKVVLIQVAACSPIVRSQVCSESVCASSKPCSHQDHSCGVCNGCQWH